MWLASRALLARSLAPLTACLRVGLGRRRRTKADDGPKMVADELLGNGMGSKAPSFGQVRKGPELLDPAPSIRRRVTLGRRHR